ncbi:hypothetical protein PPERSA_01638 [Pseudocohnilembus persalinus]|uniref:UDENN domain-containing protein n=1 Tax=Pseudocohnilembus persalinus TaxID=266149 RepID=A0A0V0R4P0_PSEPJ|nr:hypothetical protein PPERSA_01638 [Pseudocohnilembus persalinus]|eukprot:KRX09438.1 hypothetical protein PPERSA_01638 [Pseudocohnilembus persalinus]
MFNKWIEKGMKYLEKQQQKQEQQKQKNQSKLPQTLDEKKAYLVKKTTYHSDKMMNFIDNLQFQLQNLEVNLDQFPELIQKNQNSLENSVLYDVKSIKSDKNYFSPSDKFQEFIKNQKIEKFQFLDEKFQQFIDRQILFKDEVYEYNKENNQKLYCIAIVQFHHKLGPIIEYNYPKNVNHEVLDTLTYLALPDAIHNKDEDYIYFTIKNPADQNSILYGVSYFKQIKVTDEMRQNNKDLTRNQMQKSICILSHLPLFGYLVSRIAPTTQAYFDQKDFTDYNILESAYLSINNMLRETQGNLDESEIYLGTSPKALIYQFKEKTLVLLKALLLEGRILVFSLNSQSCSNFILSLTSLLPGILYFDYTNHKIQLTRLELQDHGLPFRLFDQDKKSLEMYFTIQSLDSLKSSKSYLIGTTNTLIKNNQNVDLVIDLDKKNQLSFKNTTLEKMCKLNNKEKKFMDGLVKEVQQNIQVQEKTWIGVTQNIFSMDTEWKGSNDYYRHFFHNYFKDMTIELSLFINNLKIIQNDYSQILQKNEKMFFGDQHHEENGHIQNQMIHHNQVGAENVMGMNYNSQESSKSKFIKQMREILLVNEKDLRRFNLKFLQNWLQTDNFKFWFLHRSKNLYKLSNQYYENDKNLENQDRQIFFLPGHELYYGKLNKGQKEGFGITYQMRNKIQIESEYKEGMKNGKTKIQSLDKSFYFEGEYLDDQKEKYGVLIQQKEIQYQGNFKNNNFHGQGNLTDKDGNIYEGEFKEGKKHGMGKLQYKDGNMYIGTFKQDFFEGQGQFVYANGDIYNGQFKKGQKQGNGEQIKGGEKYTGEFYNNEYEGQGNLEKEGRTYQGTFKSSKLLENIDQIIKFQTGDVWHGPVKEWKRNGEGIMNYSDGKVVYSLYNNDEFIKELQDYEIKEKMDKIQQKFQQMEDFYFDQDLLQEDVYKVQQIQEEDDEQNKNSLQQQQLNEFEDENIDIKDEFENDIDLKNKHNNDDNIQFQTDIDNWDQDDQFQQKFDNQFQDQEEDQKQNSVISYNKQKVTKDSSKSDKKNKKAQKNKKSEKKQK